MYTPDHVILFFRCNPFLSTCDHLGTYLSADYFCSLALSSDILVVHRNLNVLIHNVRRPGRALLRLEGPIVSRNPTYNHACI